MCYAIIRVTFKVSNEPASYHEVKDEEELNNTIKQLMTRDGVKKVTTFIPGDSWEVITEWRYIKHEKDN